MRDAWLKPDGQIIELDYCMHNEYANDLLEEEMSYRELEDYMESNRIQYPYQVLHKRGWVRIKTYNGNKILIIGDCMDLTKPMRNTMDPGMNSTQLKVAKRICEENGTTLHKAINDKRFH